jgi:hypothetical protein
MMARKVTADKQTKKNATEDRSERDETDNDTHLSNEGPGPVFPNFNANQQK